MACLIGILECGLLSVNTAVQRAGNEESALGTSGGQCVDELLGILVRSIIVGKGELSGCSTLGDGLVQVS